MDSPPVPSPRVKSPGVEARVVCVWIANLCRVLPSTHTALQHKAGDDAMEDGSLIGELLAALPGALFAWGSPVDGDHGCIGVRDSSQLSSYQCTKLESFPQSWAPPCHTGP